MAECGETHDIIAARIKNLIKKYAVTDKARYDDASRTRDEFTISRFSGSGAVGDGSNIVLEANLDIVRVSTSIKIKRRRPSGLSDRLIHHDITQYAVYTFFVYRLRFYVRKQLSKVLFSYRTILRI